MNPSSQLRTDTFESNVVRSLELGHIRVISRNTPDFFFPITNLGGICIDNLSAIKGER